MNTEKPSRSSGRIKTWLREPLLHFLVIGALLFLVFHFRGDAGSGGNRIVITPGQVESMTSRFLKTWQRPPTETELKGMIDDMVRGEMAAREARSMGLDQGDTIIQRRLRQKLEFLAEDLNSAPPTDANLQDWLAGHAESYRRDPRLAFRQAYLNPSRHGDRLEADAQELLARLQASGLESDESGLGDALMLPGRVPLTSQAVITSQFGQDFANQLMTLEPGRWSGPIRSGFGLHLVFVEEREDARRPELAEVRSAVERDFLADRRRQTLEQMYESLLQRYQVTIERPEVEPAAKVATAGPPAGDKP